MKTRKISVATALLFIISISVYFSSCNKDDLNPVAGNEAENAGDDYMDAEGTLKNGNGHQGNYNNNCLVTHTEDDLLGAIIDIFYNSHNDPDSIQSSAISPPIIAKYDYRRRLSKVYFTGTQDHEEFIYSGYSSLPRDIKYYVSDYLSYGQTDSLNAIINFQYNGRGDIIQLKQTNFWYPGYDFALNYSYDNRQNVTSVTRVPQNGAAFTAFTEYAATQYDNKQNFMKGNQWIKYLLLNTGFEPYYYLLFGKNNAVNWTWTWDPGYPALTFTSTFNYNSRGFAENVYLHVLDGTTELGDFTRTSASTCDNDQHHCSGGGGRHPGLPSWNHDYHGHH